MTVSSNVVGTTTSLGMAMASTARLPSITRRLAVRANPTDPTLINFEEFKDGYSNNESDFINYDLAYGELSSNGISPLAIINRTEGRFPSPPMEPLLVGLTAVNLLGIAPFIGILSAS